MYSSIQVGTFAKEPRQKDGGERECSIIPKKWLIFFLSIMKSITNMREDMIGTANGEYTERK